MSYQSKTATVYGHTGANLCEKKRMIKLNWNKSINWKIRISSLDDNKIYKMYIKNMNVHINKMLLKSLIDK